MRMPRNIEFGLGQCYQRVAVNITIFTKEADCNLFGSRKGGGTKYKGAIGRRLSGSPISTTHLLSHRAGINKSSGALLLASVLRSSVIPSQDQAPPLSPCVGRQALVSHSDQSGNPTPTAGSSLAATHWPSNNIRIHSHLRPHVLWSGRAVSWQLRHTRLLRAHSK